MGSLILIIAANTMIVFAMRYAESTDADRRGVILTNYIIGTVITFLLSDRISAGMIQSREALLVGGLAVVNAVFMVGCMFLLQISIKNNGAGITTTYNRLGVLIPTILSVIFFKEVPTVLKISGIVLSVFAIIYSYERSKTENSKNYGLLFSVLTIGGLIDFDSKLMNHLAGSEMKPIFVVGTFLLCAMIMIGVVIVKKTKLHKKEIMLGTLIGVPNCLVTFGMVSAAAALPAYIVFPVYSGSVILLVNLISAGVLKEKLSKREVISTGMIAVALILLNI